MRGDHVRVLIGLFIGFIMGFSTYAIIAIGGRSE